MAITDDMQCQHALELSYPQWDTRPHNEQCNELLSGGVRLVHTSSAHIMLNTTVHEVNLFVTVWKIGICARQRELLHVAYTVGPSNLVCTIDVIQCIQ